MYTEHDRKTIRLQGFDYAQSGAYFITVCAFDRAHIFGTIREEEMILKPVGRAVLECWQNIPSHFSFVRLDEFVVMPNHVHGIVWIDDGNVPSGRGNASGRGKACLAPTSNRNPNIMQFGQPPPRSIPSIIGSFKSAVTKSVHSGKLLFGSVWQRNYFERVIRSESELHAVRKYIRDNPINWNMDEHYR